MKKIALWLTLICIPAGAQILSQIFFQNGITPIAYCTTPGYPAAPDATSLAGWWPASNARCTGVACSNGGSVTTILDSSGNSNTMTIAGGTVTYNTNALNGNPTLTFASNAYMNMGSTISDSGGKYSSYAVFNLTTEAGGVSNTLFGTSSFGGYAWRSTNSPGTFQLMAENVANLATGPGAPIVQGTWYQANTTLQTHSSYTFRYNRTANGSGSPVNADVGPPNNFGRNSVGGTELFQGVYADSFIYTVTHNSTTVTYNECYIYGKYGSQF